MMSRLNKGLLGLALGASLVLGSGVHADTNIAGKKVIFVPISMGISLTEAWVKRMKEHADIGGYTVEIKDAAFNTGVMSELLATAISEKPDVLVVHNPTVQLLSADLLPGLGMPVALAIVIFAISWLVLRYSTAGRVAYAIGDNFATARLSGLPVRTTTLLIYAYAALTALFAGLVSAAASGTVDFRTVTSGSLLFEVILVVVLGGIPLRGGRGGMRNILVGIALLAVLRNGMTLLNLTTQTQDMLKGVVLIIAIVTDNYLNPRDTETDMVGDL